MAGVTFAGISAARARLQTIVDGLRAAASGEVLARAVAKVQAQVDRVSRSKVDAHQATGDAARELKTTTAGSLIQLFSLAYLRFHPWWPFRRGSMPPFIVSNATKIMAAELEAAILGQASPLVLAEESAAETAAAKAAQAVKKLERAAAKKAREAKREERSRTRDAKLEDGIRAREAKEG